MALSHLHRIDPGANMARFYCIDVAATLFGDVSILRTWGRIGTHGRTRLETCATVEDAKKVALQILRQKMRRGYLPAGQMLPPVLAVCDLSGLALKPALQLGTGLDGDPLMRDVGLHDRTRRELNVPRRDRAENRPTHDEVVGDDGTFNTTWTSHGDLWRPQWANDTALDLDRTTGGGIAFDDKVLREDAAAGVRTRRVRPTVQIAIWGLHLGAASAQRHADRLDQKRNERATRGAVIGEEAQ